MPLQTKMRFAFQLFLLALFAYTGWQALDFASLARYLPLTVSILAFITMLVGLVTDVWAYRRTGVVAAGEVPETAAMHGAEKAELTLQKKAEAKHGTVEDVAQEADVDHPLAVARRSLEMFGWILGYVAGIWVLGVMAATAIFLLTYLWFQARAGWKLSVFGTVLVLAGLTVMRIALNLEWPDYLLESFLT